MATGGPGGGDWGQGRTGQYPPGQPPQGPVGGHYPPPAGGHPGAPGGPERMSAPSYPQVAPAQPQAGPAAAPTAGGGQMGLVVGAIVGALVLVGGGVAAWWFLLRGPAALPLEMGKLPDDTVAIRRISLTEGISAEMRVKDVFEEAYWSVFADEVCGGENVFKILMDADDEYGRERAGQIFQDLDETKATLACGKAVASDIGKKAALYEVSFKDGKERRRVTLIPFGLDEIPETTKRMKEAKKEPDNLEKVKCLKPEGEEDKKKDSGDEEPKDRKKTENCQGVVGKLKNEKIWVQGSVESVHEFGKNFSPQGKSKPDNAELMEKLAKDTKGFLVEVGNGESARSGVLSAPGAVVKDEDVQKGVEKAMKGVKAWAVGREVKDGWASMRAEFHCDGDSDAEDLEKALNKYHKEAKSAAKEALDERMEKKEKEKDKKGDKGDEKPPEAEKYEEARVAVAVRALADAKIERSGEVVTVTVEEKPEDGEREAFDAYSKYQTERAEKVAAIVKKLADGEKPSDDDLEAVGGKKLLEAINPPEWVELDGFDGLKIPGGGACTEFGGPTDKGCRYKKLTADDALKKMKDENEKNGWKFTKQEYTDAFYDLEKGSTKVELFLMGKGSEKANFSVKKK